MPLCHALHFKSSAGTFPLPFPREISPASASIIRRFLAARVELCAAKGELCRVYIFPFPFHPIENKLFFA